MRKNNNYCITDIKDVISWKSCMLRIICEIAYLSHFVAFHRGLNWFSIIRRDTEEMYFQKLRKTLYL